jgi:hypothetical protein
MTDEKATSLAALRRQPRIELREFALAAFYPRSQPAIPLAAIAFEVADLRSVQRGHRDSAGPPENVAKPWKKPWDK